MVLAYRVIVAIVQLVFFVPGFGLGALLASRHGFGKSAGWYFLIAFTLLRSIGAISEIIAVLESSIGAFIAALVCSSIGLAPLTLLCLGMLSRVNDHTTKPLPQWIFKAISTFSLAGLILGVVGGSFQNRTSTSLVSIRPEIKAAVIIFVIIYLSTIAILCILSKRSSTVVNGEKRLLIAVTLSIPFIAVRLIYALIADFANLQSFSLAYGDTTIYLCMSVIMEIIVTIIAIAFGLTLRVLPKVVKAESNPADTEIEMTTSLREQERKKIHGPVTWIYYNAKDLIRSKRTQADGNY